MTTLTGPQEPTSAYTHRGQRLTQREAAVMDALVLGMTNQEIAKHLDISTKGIEAHMCNIRFKAGLGPRVLLALWWRDQRAAVGAS